MITKFKNFINESKSDKIEKTVKVHIYDLDNYLSDYDIETMLEDEGITEDDENYQEEYDKLFDDQLKNAILMIFFNQYKHGVPDNFMELVDDMEYELIDSTEFFKIFKIKINEPYYEDERNIPERRKKLEYFDKKFKIDKIRKDIEKEKQNKN